MVSATDTSRHIKSVILCLPALKTNASCRCYKYSSVGFTVFGVYLLGKHVFQHIIERRRHWEVRKRYVSLLCTIYHCFYCWCSNSSVRGMGLMDLFKDSNAKQGAE